MLGTSHFAVQLEPLAPPRGVRRKAQASEDDPVDFLEHQHLGEHELRFRSETRSGLIADREDGEPRDGLLVVLDFLLDVELVLVSKRSSGASCHWPAASRR